MTHLVIHIDGGSRGNPGPAAAGVVIQDPSGLALLEAGYFLGRMTNNQAEYTALVRALEAAQRTGVKQLKIQSDSELMVRQINGEYRVKNAGLAPLFDKAFGMLRGFEKWTIRHIPREQNARADELANQSMDARKDVIVEDALFNVSQSSSARAARDNPGPTSRAERNSQIRNVVRVTCERAPNGDVCPAPCNSGDEFTFERTVPGGICLNVAPALLTAVTESHLTPDPVEAVCPLKRCSARFSAICRPAD